MLWMLQPDERREKEVSSRIAAPGGQPVELWVLVANIWPYGQVFALGAICQSGNSIRRKHMAQTIWIHRLADTQKAQAEGMEYICEHLFQGLTQSGKLTNARGWHPVPNATSKDGSTYRALFCDSCAKNHNNNNIRMAKEPVLA